MKQDCISKKKPTLLRHFTTEESLFKILENGLKLSDGVSWEDKNDVYCITRYKEYQRHCKQSNNVLIVCFCDGKGNDYHWHNFNKDDSITCSINLDKQRFTEYVRHLDGFRVPKKVIYCNNRGLTGKRIADIPYLKRWEYWIEQEYRLLYVGPQLEKYIRNVKDYIVSITLDSSNESKFMETKSKLIEKYHIDKTMILQNGRTKSPKWKRGIDTIIKSSHSKQNNSNKYTL